MNHLLLFSLALTTGCSAFLPLKTTPVVFVTTRLQAEATAVAPVGTIIEFVEKKRSHLGKILQVENKSNGAVRYEVKEYPTGTHYNILDKEVSFTIPSPTNTNKEDQMLQDLEHAFVLTGVGLCRELGITPELLEIAWEETLASKDMGELTPNDLIELVHSHKASHIEKYEAWRLLRSEIGHIFFKEIKDHGRIVAFKAKPAKSVDASKDVYCTDHKDEELCNVPPHPLV